MNDQRHSLERLALDNLSAAVLLFDTEPRLRFMNLTAEMLFGVSQRKVLGRLAGDLVQCPGELVSGRIAAALREGQPITQRGVSLPLQEGDKTMVDCTVVPVVAEDGDTYVLVELQQVDRQLRISNEEQLLSQHEATRALVRGLAHEIKNPLGGLRGAAQLLERELDSAELREYTQIVIAEADRLQALVDRMLGPNRPPHEERLNIHQVLERVYQLVSAETGPQLRLLRDYDPSIPEMVGDRDLLIQAFLNLVRNAVQALQGRGTVTIRSRVARQMTIGHRRHRLVLIVEVEDDGPGVPPELEKKIYYPMVSGTNGGSGLGLSIAQALIHRHGGLIEHHSRPGRTVFSVLLPLDTGAGKEGV